MKNYDLYKHSPVYTIKELLDYCVTKHNEKDAFVYQNRKKDITISFVEFKNQVNAYGSYLFNKGFNNCHIAVFGENSYEWIVTYFAVVNGGNVIIPIDKELKANEMLTLLKWLAMPHCLVIKP